MGSRWFSLQSVGLPQGSCPLYDGLMTGPNLKVKKKVTNSSLISLFIQKRKITTEIGYHLSE